MQACTASVDPARVPLPSRPRLPAPPVAARTLSSRSARPCWTTSTHPLCAHLLSSHWLCATQRRASRLPEPQGRARPLPRALACLSSSSCAAAAACQCGGLAAELFTSKCALLSTMLCYAMLCHRSLLDMVHEAPAELFPRKGGSPAGPPPQDAFQVLEGAGAGAARGPAALSSRASAAGSSASRCSWSSSLRRWCKFQSGSSCSSTGPSSTSSGSSSGSVSSPTSLLTLMLTQVGGAGARALTLPSLLRLGQRASEGQLGSYWKNFFW